MALGSLFVELGVNSAAFVEGLNKATYQAKAATQQIGSSIRGLGSVLSEFGSQFGALGGVVGTAFTSMGNAIGKLSKEFGSFGSGVGATSKAVGIGVLGLGAAFATAGAAVVGIALHAAEGASRLHELSEATGVSAQQLSGLSIVGKLAGVDIETLAKGMERLDRSALVAAQGSGRASGAWKTLGIAVTDTTGHLKGTAELFGEVADKFSNMEDGAVKTGLAIQLFGRAGANLIPVLNKGSEAIKYWIDYGTRVGAVLSDEAAAGAHNFEEQMTKVGLISTGVQNKLMTALLPAIDHIVAAFTTFAENGTAIATFGQIVGKTLVGLAKIVFEAAFAWEWWGNKLDIWKAKYEKLMLAIESKVTGVKIDTSYLDKQIQEAENKIQKANDRLAVELADLGSKIITPAGPAEKKGKRAAEPVPAAIGEFSKPEKDYAGDLIAHAVQAAAAELELASAIGQGTAAMLLQKGATAADTAVVGTLIQITDRLKSLGQEEAAAVASGNQKKIAAIREQIKALHDQELQLVAAKDKLTALFDTKEVVAYTVQMANGFTKVNEKLKEQLKDVEAVVAAANKGGQALVEANITSKLADDQRAVNEAAEAYKLLAADRNVDAQALEKERQALAAANVQLAEHRALLERQNDLMLAEQAAHANTSAAIATENNTFARLIESTTNADAKMVLLAQHQANLNRITAEWDNAALAVGTFGQKVKAVMDQVQAESQETGKKIAEAFKTAIDGVSQNIADMVVKGKANWSSLFDSLETAIIKQLASAALARLMKALSSLGGGKDDGGEDSGGGGWFSNLVGGLFGGGKAGGGPVAPGVSYLVGEKGPEIFAPGVAGTIVPNPGSSAKQVNANITMNVHGATDPDTFKKAGPQIGAQLYRQLQIAYARNGGS